ncbi:MAG: PilZ domain-containing protein [Novosphingobium sp.]|nr:PilZ domain-containing protein [Novosphingobium sp.]
MTAKLARLAPVETDTQDDRRREARHTARGFVRVESVRGDKADATLADVSTHGCAIKVEAEWLRIGGFVSIGLEDQPLLQAIVRWVRDGNAGMEFLRPVPPDRVEWHELMDASFGG